MPVHLVTVVGDWVRWFGLGRLLAVSASVLAVGLGAAWVLRTPAPPTESRLPYATRTSSGTTTVSASASASGGAVGPTTARNAPGGAPGTPESAASSVATAPAPIVVDVVGAVGRPGVLRLPAGARVVDAIAAAGGPTADAQLELLNQAAVLRDGDRIVVPSAAGPSIVPPGVVHSSTDPVTDTSAVGPVDLNRAGVDELDRLPGVGPATAAAIVAYRDEHGPFASVDDLGKVRGIGPAKLAVLRPEVTV